MNNLNDCIPVFSKLPCCVFDIQIKFQQYSVPKYFLDFWFHVNLAFGFNGNFLKNALVMP